MPFVMGVHSVWSVAALCVYMNECALSSCLCAYESGVPAPWSNISQNPIHSDIGLEL